MIGIVSDDEFLSELNSHAASHVPSEQSEPNEIVEPPVPSDEVHPAEVIDIKRGRGATLEVPESLRKVIADSAIDGASAQSIAKAFGISPSSISAYKNGATSTASYNKPDSNLLGHTLNRKNRIADKATRRILQALHHISPEKLADQSVKTLAGVAKDMSAVVKNMNDGVNGGANGVNVTGPNYIIYAPRVRKEQEFTVVDSVDEF